MEISSSMRLAELLARRLKPRKASGPPWAPASTQRDACPLPKLGEEGGGATLLQKGEEEEEGLRVLLREIANKSITRSVLKPF